MTSYTPDFGIDEDRDYEAAEEDTASGEAHFEGAHDEALFGPSGDYDAADRYTEPDDSVPDLDHLFGTASPSSDDDDAGVSEAEYVEIDNEADNGFHIGGVHDADGDVDDDEAHEEYDDDIDALEAAQKRKNLLQTAAFGAIGVAAIGYFIAWPVYQGLSSSSQATPVAVAQVNKRPAAAAPKPAEEQQPAQRQTARMPGAAAPEQSKLAASAQPDPVSRTVEAQSAPFSAPAASVPAQRPTDLPVSSEEDLKRIAFLEAQLQNQASANAALLDRLASLEGNVAAFQATSQQPQEVKEDDAVSALRAEISNLQRNLSAQAKELRDLKARPVQTTAAAKPAPAPAAKAANTADYPASAPVTAATFTRAVPPDVTPNRYVALPITDYIVVAAIPGKATLAPRNARATDLALRLDVGVGDYVQPWGRIASVHMEENGRWVVTTDTGVAREY